jgi:hypothetical protein
MCLSTTDKKKGVKKYSVAWRKQRGSTQYRRKKKRVLRAENNVIFLGKIKELMFLNCLGAYDRNNSVTFSEFINNQNGQSKMRVYYK